MRHNAFILVTAMVTGLSVAFWELVDAGPASGQLPENVVAMVGGEALTAGHYDAAISLLAADRKTALTGREHQLVLDRLIDEELLIRHGLDMGYIQNNRSLRKAIARQVIANTVAEADANKPDRDSLYQFYLNHPERFRYPGQLHVTASRLQDTGEWRALPLPNSLTPDAVIYRQLGQQAAKLVASMQNGQTRSLTLSDNTQIRITLLARQQGQLPSFDDVQRQVETEYVKQARDKALSDLLIRLRRHYDIYLHPGLAPQTGPKT